MCVYLWIHIHCIWVFFFFFSFMSCIIKLLNLSALTDCLVLYMSPLSYSYKNTDSIQKHTLVLLLLVSENYCALQCPLLEIYINYLLLELHSDLFSMSVAWWPELPSICWLWKMIPFSQVNDSLTSSLSCPFCLIFFILCFSSSWFSLNSRFLIISGLVDVFFFCFSIVSHIAHCPTSPSLPPSLVFGCQRSLCSHPVAVWVSLPLLCLSRVHTVSLSGLAFLTAFTLSIVSNV